MTQDFKKNIEKNKPKDIENIVAGFVIGNYFNQLIDFIPKVYVYITGGTNTTGQFCDFDFSKEKKNAVITVGIDNLDSCLKEWNPYAWEYILTYDCNMVVYDNIFNAYRDKYKQKLLVATPTLLVKSILNIWNKKQNEILSQRTKIINESKKNKNIDITSSTELIDLSYTIFNELINLTKFGVVLDYFRNKKPIYYGYNLDGEMEQTNKDTINSMFNIFAQLPAVILLSKPQIAQKLLQLFKEIFVNPTLKMIKYQWSTETTDIDSDIDFLYQKLKNSSDTIIKIIYHSSIDKIEPIQQGDWIDLRLAEDVYLKKGEIGLFSLGVTIKLPKGYEAIVVPRSSLGIKYGVMQLNSMGVIDNSYCGDGDIWKIPLYAIRDTSIERNTRVCQFRLLPNQRQNLGRIKFKEIKQGEENTENRGGFGSTGEK